MRPIVLCVSFSALLLAGCKVDVYEGLNQRDANEMTAALIQAGVPADRRKEKDGTFTVIVDENRFSEAVTVLQASGLPRESFKTLDDVFSADNGIVPSPVEENALLSYALSQELSRTVSDIDGVVSARVHLVIPNQDPLARNKEQASASVAIYHDEAFDTAGVVPRIKLIIANGVAGLDYDRVSIALFAQKEQGSAGYAAQGMRQNGSAPSQFSAAFEDKRAANITMALLIGAGLLGVMLLGAVLFGGGRRKAPAYSEAPRRGTPSRDIEQRQPERPRAPEVRSGFSSRYQRR